MSEREDMFEVPGSRLKQLNAEITALRARLSSAEAERDRLREGLELFVRHGRAMGVFGGDNGPYRYYTGSGYREVPVEDFRRARALLTPQAETR